MNMSYCHYIFILQSWPWLLVTTGYVYGIMHCIHGVSSVLITGKWHITAMSRRRSHKIPLNHHFSMVVPGFPMFITCSYDVPPPPFPAHVRKATRLIEEASQQQDEDANEYIERAPGGVGRDRGEKVWVSGGWAYGLWLLVCLRVHISGYIYQSI